MPIIALHFVAGLIAGTIFAVRTLVILAGFVLAECAVAAVAIGYRAALYSIGSLIALQMGYLAGVGLRAVLHRNIAPSPRWRRHEP